MRLLIAALGVAATSLFAPAAEACSCTCALDKNQPGNPTERRQQVHTTLSNFDYAFIGEVIAIGDAIPLPADAYPFAAPYHAVTIRPAKIAKGPASNTITVLARLGDGSNCYNELAVGGLFRGLAKREGDTWVASNLNCDCDNWAIFDRGGPLADEALRKSLYGCAN